jgi:hypothetical protein
VERIVDAASRARVWLFRRGTETFSRADGALLTGFASLAPRRSPRADLLDLAGRSSRRAPEAL